MSWSNFVANIKATGIKCEETPEASRYGGIPDMYLSPVIADSSPELKNITPNLCFVTVGNADLAISALFISETNILHIDWDTKVLNAAQLRIEEMLQVMLKEEFQPSKLHDNKKICENDFKQPYDFEYWERMNMALIVHYRKKGDPRAEELADELKLEHEKYEQREKHLEILDHGHKYKINEFDRESMQEFSIENQRVLLSENYYKTNCKMFFRYVDEKLLRTLENKKFLDLNLNLLNSEIIDSLVKTMLKNKIQISRLNLTDLLDEIIADPENLQAFIETIKKLNTVMVKKALIIVNHINDYSLCVEIDKAIIVLNLLLKEIKEIKKNPRVGELPILEQFNDNYLKSFIKYSVNSADKRMFYPNA